MITRLRGRGRFRALHQQGTRVRYRTLWCLMLNDSTPTNTPTSAGPTEVGYAIGRVNGSAVERNRLRRRLRALLADRAERLPTGALLIGATPEAARLGSAELAEALDGLLARMDAVRGDVTVA